MGTILDKIADGVKSIFTESSNQSLSGEPKNTHNKKRILKHKMRSISRTRDDIKSWKKALAIYEREIDPKTFAIQLLWKKTMDDALLSSQIENRQTKVFGIDWSLKGGDGEIDEAQTLKLKDSGAATKITKAMLEAHYLEYSMIELGLEKNIEGEIQLNVHTVPRENIVPRTGRFYPDYTQDDFINYRNLREYGSWLLEFNSDKMGEINKAVKHVLMKDFAQSCWAELCEIYGIPPRFLKTNTQDPEMLTRAEAMMSDMGAASWYIIDETEEFQFADGVTTTGDVYSKLINLCNTENSMLISGAIIGQDTKNGSRSKDESAQDVLWELVLQDMLVAEEHWNRTVIPALKKIGFLTGDVKFRYSIPEDLKELWKRVVEALPHYEIDPEWVKTKFGIEITGKKQSPVMLNHGEGFFV